MPPEPMRKNIAFLGIMDYAQIGRDGFSGRIDLNGFMRVLDLYSEIHNLDCWDKMEMLEKLIVVTRVEDEKRETDSMMNAHPRGERTPIGKKG